MRSALRIARTASRRYAVEAHNLVKTYPGGVRAVDGVSLAVEPGEVFGLLGPNGAGKSTTMRILTTLSRPDSGDATVAGHDVVRDPDQVRRVIGVVAQKSGSDPLATGLDNLLLQGRLYGLRGARLRRRVDELLHQFDLTGAAGRLARTYSGGMLRRLDVALSLVHTPRVLFLDEPTVGLDPQTRATLWHEIGWLAKQKGLAILLTTHHLDEVDQIADRLAIVDRGRIVVTGHPDELKDQLCGDAVRIELHGSLDQSDELLAQRAIGEVTGIREISVERRRVLARADDGAAAIPAVLAALDRAGVRVAGVTVARPSLDDVYMRYVGRGITAAGLATVPAEPVGAR